jgi:hypothetical protein
MGPAGPAARVIITPDLAVRTLTEAIHQGKADALLETLRRRLYRDENDK